MKTKVMSQLLFMKKMQHLSCALILCVLLSSCCFSGGSIFEASGDVGVCNIPGSVSYDEATKTYTVTASGKNMWEKTDQFFMVWKKVSGDFSLSAKIAFEGPGANLHRKMGLIIRESLDTDAVYADIAIHSGDGLTALQYRLEKGAITEHIVSENKASDYLTLERHGDKILMKTASGHFTDQADGELSIQLPETCYVGLFMCSHEADISETGYFSEVKFEKL